MGTNFAVTWPFLHVQPSCVVLNTVTQSSWMLIIALPVFVRINLSVSEAPCLDRNVQVMLLDQASRFPAVALRSSDAADAVASLICGLHGCGMDPHQHHQHLFFLLPPGTVESGGDRGSSTMRSFHLPKWYRFTCGLLCFCVFVMSFRGIVVPLLKDRIIRLLNAHVCRAQLGRSLLFSGYRSVFSGK